MKKLVEWVILIILIVVTTPAFGRLYEIIVQEDLGSGSWWGPEHPEYIVGFYLAYCAFVPLVGIMSSWKNKTKIILILLGLMLLFLLWLGTWDMLLFSAITAAIGWLIGFGLSRVIKLKVRV